MKCPKCGAENSGIRLFCVNCGEMLNDDDEPKSEPDIKKPQAPAEIEDAPVDIEDAPIDIEDAPIEVKSFAKPKPAIQTTIAPPKPKKRADTHVPERKVDPDSFFEVEGGTEFDDFDTPANDVPDDDILFEQRETGSFFVRHIRGIVALFLLFATVTAVLVWARTDSGQSTLARMGIAWSGSAYANEGVKYYNAGNYQAAEQYFINALDHANSATEKLTYYVYITNCCIMLGDKTGAANALMKCIEIEPTNAEYYVSLKSVYGDDMPESVRQIIEKGCKLTGDERLK